MARLWGQVNFRHITSSLCFFCSYDFTCVTHSNISYKIRDQSVQFSPLPNCKTPSTFKASTCTCRLMTECSKYTLYYQTKSCLFSRRGRRMNAGLEKAIQEAMLELDRMTTEGD